jgi:hypothetical protein
MRNVEVQISVTPVLGIFGGQGKADALVVKVKGSVVLVQKDIAQNPALQ